MFESTYPAATAGIFIEQESYAFSKILDKGL